MDKARVESQGRSDWELRKPFEGGAGTVPLRRRGERSLKPSRLCLICGLLSGHKSAGIPRGYAPLVAGQELRTFPRRGGREP